MRTCVSPTLSMLFAAAALAACGGGSDPPSAPQPAGGTPAPAPNPTPTPPPPPPPPAPPPPPPPPASASAACFDLDPADGKTARIEYAYTGGGQQVDQWLYTRNATFEGQSTTEARTISTTGFGTTVQAWTLRNFARPDGNGNLLTFGWTIDSSTTTNGAVTGTLQEHLVYTPAALDTHASMAVGETRTFGPYPYNKTSTINGVAQPAQNASVSSTWKFVGIERITVPAGSFDTCRWETGSPTATRHELVGHGLLVRQVVPGIQTIEATSLVVNGAAP